MCNSRRAATSYSHTAAANFTGFTSGTHKMRDEGASCERAARSYVFHLIIAGGVTGRWFALNIETERRPRKSSGGAVIAIRRLRGIAFLRLPSCEWERSGWILFFTEGESAPVLLGLGWCAVVNGADRECERPRPASDGDRFWANSAAPYAAGKLLRDSGRGCKIHKFAMEFLPWEEAHGGFFSPELFSCVKNC